MYAEPHTPTALPGNKTTSINAKETSNDDQSSSAPSEYWPRSDSSDPEDGPGQSTTSSKLRRATNASKPSGTTRFFRAILQRFGRSYNKKYDFLPNDRSFSTRYFLSYSTGAFILPRLQNRGGNLATKRHPKSIVLGIDIEPVVPPFNLPNCRFQVMDFADKWSFDKGFDFVHLRMLGSLPRRMKQIGQSVAYPEAYRSSLRRAGFVNITERKYAVPINAWPPGKSLQKLGAMMMANILDIVDIISLPIFTNILGWSPEALENLLVDVRKEVQDPNIHTFMTL
ncbi:hypothetical protein F5Y15DRAFT_411035 [Xylariaceae sp. FL0016]|nr:hypothetical protein F5Y15DRAFT_411035 [Xylariaceae sp. FL0016]